MRRSMSAQALAWTVGAAALMLMCGSSAKAGIIEPELSVTGGAGVPGGTVSVTLSLSDDIDDVGVSAGVDLRFADDALEFLEPVDDSCTVAERLSETHVLAGMLLDAGLLNVEELVSGTPNPVPPLGNGELWTCDFRIKDGVPAGTVALEIEAPFLGDADGNQIPVRVRNGSVQIISEPPTSTPTATATPQSTRTSTTTATVTSTPVATSTPTNTQPVTATATATATATNTRPTATATVTNTPVTPATATATATATRTGATPTVTRKPSSGGGGGCNVVPADPAAAPGAAALLLLPALFLWVRRRGL